ncbi:MAG: hypothetical protein JXB50_06100 [Spirochaetes bacterium]|nr:hypothetical protein [Spirochaetota bacterium]
MKDRILFNFFVISLAIFLISCPIETEEKKEVSKIIAQYTNGTDEITISFDMGSMAGIKICQGFKIASGSNCKSVDLYATTKLFNPTGDYTLRIEIDNAGKPSGTLVNPDAVVSKNGVNITENSWNNWSFPNLFSLTANTTYWIVFTTNESSVIPDQPGIKFYYDSTGTYADGAYGSYDSMMFNWTINTDLDLRFRVYKE